MWIQQQENHHMLNEHFTLDHPNRTFKVKKYNMETSLKWAKIGLVVLQIISKLNIFQVIKDTFLMSNQRIYMADHMLKLLELLSIRNSYRVTPYHPRTDLKRTLLQSLIRQTLEELKIVSALLSSKIKEMLLNLQMLSNNPYFILYLYYRF